MSEYISILVAVSVILLVSAILAILFAKSAVSRLLIVATFGVALYAGVTAPYKLLSWPKPADMEVELKDLEAAPIVWFYARDGEPIEIIYEIDEARRFYVYPWNEEMARSIEETMREVAQNGGVPMMGKPFKGAAGPFGQIGNAIGEIIEGLFGEGQGQGEGQGEGQGQGQGEGEPGEGNGTQGDDSLEDRRPPMAYPAPPAPLPPKQRRK